MWKRIRNIALLIGALACPILVLTLPTLEALLAVSVSALCVLILSSHADQLEKRDLNMTIKTQGDAAKDLIDEVNFRYSNALLAQEMGKTTSKVLDVDRRMDAIAVHQRDPLQLDSE